MPAASRGALVRSGRTSSDRKVLSEAAALEADGSVVGCLSFGRIRARMRGSVDVDFVGCGSWKVDSMPVLEGSMTVVRPTLLRM